MKGLWLTHTHTYMTSNGEEIKREIAAENRALDIKEIEAERQELTNKKSLEPFGPEVSRECPSGCLWGPSRPGLRSVQKVSRECPPGVFGTPFDTPGTLSGHSRDTFWTLRSLGGARRVPETPRGTLRDTSGPKGLRDSRSRPGALQKNGQKTDIFEPFFLFWGVFFLFSYFLGEAKIDLLVIFFFENWPRKGKHYSENPIFVLFFGNFSITLGVEEQGGECCNFSPFFGDFRSGGNAHQRDRSRETKTLKKRRSRQKMEVFGFGVLRLS